MKTIKFTDQELESMIEMYTAEMEEAKLYISKIQEILKKLGGKPAAEVVVEQEPKKKRGRKPSVKAVEVKERKKPGRKPKAVVPEVKTVAKDVKPAKKEKVAKAKAEKKTIFKPTPIKKTSKVTPEFSAKSVPVAANRANTKVAKPKKEKVAKVKADKPGKKEVKKEVSATIESVVSSLLTTAPKKEVVKVVKKKVVKTRNKGFVRLAPLGKPLARKVVDEPAPVEPTAPAGQS